MAESSPVHLDRLGRELILGDSVCYCDQNSLQVGIVNKLNPKMVGLSTVTTRSRRNVNKYPFDVVRVSGDDVTMFLLKYSK